MGLIQNNVGGGEVVSSATTFFDDGVIIAAAGAIPADPFPQFYFSEWVPISGLPKLAVQVETTTEGGPGLPFPDGNVGQVLVTVQVASNNTGEFGGLGGTLRPQIIGDFLCPMSDTALYAPNSLFQEWNGVNSKYVRVSVAFGYAPLAGTEIAKMYLRIMAGQ